MSEAASRMDTAAGVPLLDLKAQYASIRDDIETAIRDVCESQYFVLGPKVAELEAQIARYAGCEFGIGVSSGTDALLVALMALDVAAGDEVITSPFTFFATGGVVSRLGATPVFCDIEPDTYNLDPQSVREFLESHCERRQDGLINTRTGNRVRVLMPVHLFGQTADMGELCAIAREYGLQVVEDAAQAIGAEEPGGGRAGSLGDIGCFSFFPSKNLGAFGDGGMCVTNDAALAERMRILRVHGGKPKYYHAVVGGNFRLDAIQAAILTVKLRFLDEWTSQRQRNARQYDELLAPLADRIGLPHVRGGARHVFNQYTLRCTDRDDLRAALSDKGIGTEIYYPVPLHLQKCFASLGYEDGACPESERAAGRVLSVPIYSELTDAQQAYVASAIADFYGA